MIGVAADAKRRSNFRSFSNACDVGLVKLSGH
jgi:hypothetical protein